jgi:hypothetical protein
MGSSVAVWAAATAVDTPKGHRGANNTRVARKTAGLLEEFDELLGGQIGVFEDLRE